MAAPTSLKERLTSVREARIRAKADGDADRSDEKEDVDSGSKDLEGDAVSAKARDGSAE